MNYNRYVKDFDQNNSQKVYLDSNLISKFISSTFGWMFIGLIITSLTIFILSHSYLGLRIFYGNMMYPYLILALEASISLYLSNVNVNKITLNMSRILFICYSILNGITLSFLSLYDLNIIGFVALTTSILFGFMALYGYLTKQDLTRFNSLIKMSSIILLIMLVLNIFIKVPIFNLVIGYFGAITFMIIIVRDVNNLKKLANDIAIYESVDNINKYSIKGALNLYINIINLFLYILQIFLSRKRDNKRK